jgi:hypothetical protein
LAAAAVEPPLPKTANTLATLTPSTPGLDVED